LRAATGWLSPPLKSVSVFWGPKAGDISADTCSVVQLLLPEQFSICWILLVVQVDGVNLEGLAEKDSLRLSFMVDELCSGRIMRQQRVHSCFKPYQQLTPAAPSHL